MTPTHATGPQLIYVIVAFVVLALAFVGIIWVGRQIRGELGPGASSGGGGDLSGLAASLEQIPPALMKEAIAKGLVVPSQLATMSPVERSFLFSTLKQKLEQMSGTATAESSQPAAPVSQPAPAPAPPPAPRASAPIARPALPADLPPAMAAMLNEEKLRVWCPMCGTELQLPSFPPLVARCSTCGHKTAVRAEEGGRYTVIVSPPPRA